jgi:NAD(P)-dependent dehydrogenase (short-subunit alcohol dehydrogenase family)
LTQYLAGKAVVITGSGRGVGAACANHAAAHGAAVVVNDIDQGVAEAVAGEIRATGAQAIAVTADIATWEGAEKLIASCVSEFGRIDGLVNNAGLLRMSALVDQSAEDMRAMVETNLVGLVACSSFAARQMSEQRSGSIVNVSSGAQCGIVAQGVYSGTKGAVASMTYTWAMELAGSGVRVNAISPHARTRMVTHAAEYRERQGQPPLYTTEAPEPADNAPIVTYLLSDRSSNVTGQIVRVDGQLLGLYAHPAVMLPVQRRARWEVDGIAEAFTSDLESRQAPLGISGIQVTAFVPDSKEWAVAREE